MFKIHVKYIKVYRKDTFISYMALINMFDFIQIETNLRKLIYLGFEKFPVHVLEISSLVTDSQMRSVTPFISTNKIHHACLNFSLIKSEIHIYWRDPNKNLTS